MNSRNIKLISISELAKELNLVNKFNHEPQTHTIRYWEKNFKQIRPTILGTNRRYYSSKDVEFIKFIKFILKDEGFTIKGVKKLLKKNINKLDDKNTSSIKAHYLKLNLKKKSLRLLNKIKSLKK